MDSAAAKKRCIEIIERYPEQHLPSLATSLEAMYNMIDDDVPLDDFIKELRLDIESRSTKSSSAK